MPRVYLSEADRIKDRFIRWLVGEMKIQKVSQTAIAKEIGLSQQMFSYKLKHRTFDYCEFIQIIRFLKPEQDEILHLIGR